MSEERRGHGRLTVRQSRLRSPTLKGRVINLSATGMAIETHQSLRIGSQYYFLLDRKGRAMRLEGRVLWCRLKATVTDGSGDVTPVYRAGIERVTGSRGGG